MVDQLLRSEPDIIHAHWTYEYELAAQDCGIPHVTTAHDSPWTMARFTPDAYRIARLGLALRARPGIRSLAVVSPYLLGKWRTTMGYRTSIRVIPNSIPGDLVNLVHRPAQQPIFLEVADSGRRKNIRNLLRAFALVRRDVPHATLRLVGPGLEYSSGLSVWARANGLDDGVAFLGTLTRSALAREYQQAWIMVHSSVEESFGISVLEAAAAGLHVIASRHAGGPPFILSATGAGHLVNVESPTELARGMLSCVYHGPRAANPSVTDALQSRFSRRLVARTYARWYAETMNTSDSVG
jgi:glycosyltransferase involved in cell wall biosynthesis